MKKPRSIFYLVYFLFHIGLLLASIYVNYKSEDFEFLLKLREKMDISIYVAIGGLVLFFIDIILVTMEARNHKKEMENLDHEVNSLKAKMFDLQQASKPTTTRRETPGSETPKEDHDKL